MKPSIDLRSDTVTLPTEEMKTAMYNADLGDDVYGDDPTINRLEKIAADMMKSESALFFPSGTQSNLCALLSHCQRGDEYICGQNFHIYKYEAGGGAVLGGIQPQPLETETDGSFGIEKIESVIKPDDYHFPVTKLLCLENTLGGKVISLEKIKQTVSFARKRNLSVHLDGARIFNAATELNVPVDHISSLFDTISVCLSKGLAAPAGTVLCGKKDLITKARRWRKMVGGGMRQSGILAAAGIIALEKMSRRLNEDHDNAKQFARFIGQHTDLICEHHTNMVFVKLNPAQIEAIGANFALNGIKASLGPLTRFVFHKDISRENTEHAAKLLVSSLG